MIEIKVPEFGESIQEVQVASWLKKPGDWVVTGDPIARVGDSGGQNKSALYFEIRQSGNPVNPALWCKY